MNINILNIPILYVFDPTAVDGIEADEDNGPKVYYDMLGRKSDAPRRGLNIVKGKKILVK